VSRRGFTRLTKVQPVEYYGRPLCDTCTENGKCPFKPSNSCTFYTDVRKVNRDLHELAALAADKVMPLARRVER